jgi:putative ABC transport system substrate-binding protein
MPAIGILHSQTQSSEAARLAAIEQGLKDSGFGVGRNVTIEHRFADGHNDRLPMLAAELVRMQVNVILANTTPPAIAAKAATATIPIVFVTGVDPVEFGLVASFNRPGANVTGVTFLSNKLVAKRLELLSNLVPGTAPIGMLAAQRNPNTETDVRDALAAANVLGRTLHVVKIPPDGTSMPRSLPWCLAIKVAVHHPRRIQNLARSMLALAMRHALPTSFASSDIVTAGGLMSYGPDQNDSYREAGIYVGRILKGEKPADLPILVATKFEFVINLRTAKALSLTIPPSLLALATNVIE